jgi:hypothetical protein
LEKGIRPSFVYTPAALADLESVLSIDRFATYTAAVGDNRRRAIALYEWNGAISAAFYIPLQIVARSRRLGVSHCTGVDRECEHMRRAYRRAAGFGLTIMRHETHHMGDPAQNTRKQPS